MLAGVGLSIKVLIISTFFFPDFRPRKRGQILSLYFPISRDARILARDRGKIKVQNLHFVQLILTRRGAANVPESGTLIPRYAQGRQIELGKTYGDPCGKFPQGVGKTRDAVAGKVAIDNGTPGAAKVGLRGKTNGGRRER